jgi:small acid-soluble spore protein N (minor)
MVPLLLDKIVLRRGSKMGKGYQTKRFRPTHIGTQPRSFGGNKGKQMQDNSGEHAQVMQTKGE